MDFLAQQEAARRASRWLLLAFVVAILLIVLAVHGILLLLWQWMAPGQSLPPHFTLTNTTVVLLIILGGAALEIWRLRRGGQAVAEMAGGRRISPDTTDPQLRRVLNVVEEMAIASRLPVPPVYLLERETAINAFAAGWSTQDAVLGLTRGAIDQLDRKELQGVVAHEFSHVLNGDMRLNLQLLGLLHGIFLLSELGRQLLRSRHHRRVSRDGRIVAVAVALGLVLWLVGSIGLLTGRLIQAAVSRQREFLADAAAVEFTRHPDGIGQALRRIAGLPAGSQLDHGPIETLAHLYLGAPMRARLGALMATHPPLQERIRRIYGRHLPALPARDTETAAARGTSPPLEPLAWFGDQTMAPSPSRSPDTVAEAESASPMASLPPLEPDLAETAHDPARVAPLVLALLGDREGLALLPPEPWAHTAFEMLNLTQSLSPGERLHWLDRCHPALSLLPVPHATRLIEQVDTLIRADGRLELLELVGHVLLMRRLAALPNPRAGSIDDAAAAWLTLQLFAHLEPARSQHRLAAGLQAYPIAGTKSLPTRLGPALLDQALARLRHWPALRKPAIIKAWRAVVLETQDAQVRDTGTVLLHQLSTCIEVPLPPEFLPFPDFSRISRS
jgi:Zn-dependent protease with chaperone function